MDVIMRYLVTIFWDPNWPLEKKIVVVTAGVAVLLIFASKKIRFKRAKENPVQGYESVDVTKGWRGR
jgi:hypothetical protein